MREAWEQFSTYVHFADAFAFGADWSLPHRINPFTTLWLLQEGEIEFTVASDVVIARSNDLLLVPTGTPFRGTYFSSCVSHRLIALRFTLRTLEQLDWFARYRLPYILPQGLTTEVERMALEVVQLHHDTSQSTSKMKANAVMQQLLANILCKHEEEITPCAGTRAAQQHVFKLIRWMEEHLETSFELKDLAQEAYLSQDYIHELFISVVGLSPCNTPENCDFEKQSNFLI